MRFPTKRSDEFEIRRDLLKTSIYYFNISIDRLSDENIDKSQVFFM